MRTGLATAPNAPLVRSDPGPLDRNPAAVYLAGLQPTGRRTQAQALATIARLLGAADAFSVSWSSLRFQHTAAIRSRLAETYQPATANKMPSAIRQVLKAAWRLGQMTAEDYQRAADLDPVTGETIPAGRELSPGEILALMQTCQDDPGRGEGRRGAASTGSGESLALGL